MVETDIEHDLLLHNLNELANQSLHLWPIPEGASARLINVSENATYLIEGSKNYKSILRIHRENYHTHRAIECELLWMDALKADNCILVPGIIAGNDGNKVQIGKLSEKLDDRFMVLFEFVEGLEPDETHDLIEPFEELGELAAKTHEHSIAWTKPKPFERLVWDLEAVFGSNPTWENWRDAPNVDQGISDILEQVESTVRKRLMAFGQSKQQYGLIHADMRLANLLIDETGTRLIDFDDCGSGWFLYDFATGISFIEDDPQIPDLQKAWVRGYRKIRSMSDGEEREIGSFIMLRRMALLAWIGSHINVPEAQKLAPNFAHISAVLGEDYLSKMA